MQAELLVRDAILCGCGGGRAAAGCANSCRVPEQQQGKEKTQGLELATTWSFMLESLCSYVDGHSYPALLPREAFFVRCSRGFFPCRRGCREAQGDASTSSQWTGGGP